MNAIDPTNFSFSTLISSKKMGDHLEVDNVVTLH